MAIILQQIPAAPAEQTASGYTFETNEPDFHEVPDSVDLISDPVAAILLTLTIFVLALFARPLMFLMTLVIQFGIILTVIFFAVRFFVYGLGF